MLHNLKLFMQINYYSKQYLKEIKLNLQMQDSSRDFKKRDQFLKINCNVKKLSHFLAPLFMKLCFNLQYRRPK